MKCEVTEGIKCNTLRWFGHLKRMKDSETTGLVYVGKIGAVAGPE